MRFLYTGRLPEAGEAAGWSLIGALVETPIYLYLSLSIYIYIYTYICTCIIIYIYIYIAEVLADMYDVQDVAPVRASQTGSQWIGN